MTRRDVHAPGFYIDIEPVSCFMGLGIWHPDASTLNRIRQSLAEHPTRWKRVIGGKRLSQWFKLGGESLKRAPRGYDPEHPLIEDLKRKDFIAVTRWSERDVLSRPTS